MEKETVSKTAKSKKKSDVREEVGKLVVTSSYKKTEPEKMESSNLEVRQFLTEVAHIRAGYGLTINMGNYESARVDVSVTLPCYMEEIKDAFAAAWKITEAEIQKQVAELTENRGRR